MNYARWSNLKEFEKSIPLTKINSKSEVKTSGIPMAYDENNIYVDCTGSSSLVIGSTGSGKTQAITLPMLDIACKVGESVIVTDNNNELYEKTKDMFIEKDYKVYKINFDNSKDSNHWNPLELIKLYKEMENMDAVSDLISDLGYYLLNDPAEKSSDPFWINSAISYFTGITLYCLENYDEVTFEKIYEIDELVRENPKEFLNKIDKKSSIYINLLSILSSPPETMGSILSVFNQKFKMFLIKEDLNKTLSSNDINLLNISVDKTIIYLNIAKSYTSEHLLPLFIHQVYSSKENSLNRMKLNIIFDDFYTINPIRNCAKLLNNSRTLNLVFTIFIRGFNDLINVYSKDECERIKITFKNMIYLLSQDMDTLKSFSEFCGNSIKGSLITVEELKTLKTFEAVIVTVRMMPFKTKLLPYYKMNK